MTIRHEIAEPRRATGARSETRVTREPDEGSRSEVRGFRNFEPRTSNFESRFSRQFRPSRLSHGSAIAAETFMNSAGQPHAALRMPCKRTMRNIRPIVRAFK